MHIVVLSGGVGSRLWPVSRKLHPKPFIKLSNQYSILQNTFLRAIDLHPQGIVNVTSSDFFFKVRNEWDQLFASGLQNKEGGLTRDKALLSELLGIKSKSLVKPEYILEPFGRNTAAAIAMASLWILNKSNEDELILVMPSDHLIADTDSFCKVVKEAGRLAEQDRIVTFGVTASAPETGYGYIEFEGNAVKSFKEKPTLEKAKEYVASGNYLWNAGMFCFKAGVMLEEIARYCPDILSDTKTCFEKSKAPAEGVLRIEADTFLNIREDSIDYAVMEKSDRVSVVACDIGWSDIGNWNAINETGKKDSCGNVVNASAVLEKTTNSFIEGRDRLIAVVGVDNLIIVDTPDALLIANKNNTQDVKNVYNRLAKSGHRTHEVHTTVHRPWGSYTLLEESSNFKIRRVEVLPNESLSLQSHKYRSEHWVVVAGKAKVDSAREEQYLEVGQSTFIPAGVLHRLSNASMAEILVIIEVQTGSTLSDDDVERHEEGQSVVQCVS